MIVFDTLPSREVVMDQCRADARYFVRANRRANSAAADCYAAICRACGNRFAKRDDEIGIVVVGIQAIRPKSTTS